MGVSFAKIGVTYLFIKKLYYALVSLISYQL